MQTYMMGEGEIEHVGSKGHSTPTYVGHFLLGRRPAEQPRSYEVTLVAELDRNDREPKTKHHF